jgi:CheY-like chemotaxis protein
MTPVPILAVDDEDLIREFLVAALESGGYEVIEAASAEAAYVVLSQNLDRLGGLVTDVNLGRGQPSGWDLARRAREMSASLPVVYITGDSAASWSAQGVPHSALIQKPFTSADLVVALAELRKQA